MLCMFNFMGRLTDTNFQMSATQAVVRLHAHVCQSTKCVYIYNVVYGNIIISHFVSIYYLLLVILLYHLSKIIYTRNRAIAEVDIL